MNEGVLREIVDKQVNFVSCKPIGCISMEVDQ